MTTDVKKKDKSSLISYQEQDVLVLGRKIYINLCKPLMGLEPIVFWLEARRLIHWAIRANIAEIGFNPMTFWL